MVVAVIGTGFLLAVFARHVWLTDALAFLANSVSETVVKTYFIAAGLPSPTGLTFNRALSIYFSVQKDELVAAVSFVTWKTGTATVFETNSIVVA